MLSPERNALQTGRCRCSAIKRICLATDFSPAAEVAASYARALALSFSATVQIVHIFDTDIFLDEDEGRIRSFAHRHETRSNCLMEVAKAFDVAGLKATTTLKVDMPAWNGVLKAANEGNADLIVAATKSKAQLKRIFIGSTDEELIRRSNLPVMSIGPNVKLATDGPTSFSRVVYATDFSAEAERAAKCALSFAERDGATVYVCHVVAPTTNHLEATAPSVEDAQEAMERLVVETSGGKCSCTVTIARGNPADAVLSLAADVDADLIVLGSRKSTFWLTHVERGVSLEVLARSNCPVLTIH